MRGAADRLVVGEDGVGEGLLQEPLNVLCAENGDEDQRQRLLIDVTSLHRHAGKKRCLLRLREVEEQAVRTVALEQQKDCRKQQTDSLFILLRDESEEQIYVPLHSQTYP